MKKPLKIALLVAGCLAVTLAVLVVLGLNLHPTLFKDQIAKVVKDTSGLDVSFDGPIRTTYFPSLGLELNKVTVMTPKNAGGGVLARFGKAQVSVKLGPLFSGRVETGEMAFDAVELDLVRNEQGRLNLPMPPVKEVKIEDKKVVVVTMANERYSFDYQIADVKLTNSRFSLDDRMTGNKIALWDVSLSTGSVVRGKPFPVKLGYDYALATPEAAGRVDLQGQATAVPEALRFDFENARLKTTAYGKGLPVTSAEATYTGTIRVDGHNQTFQGDQLTFEATAKGGVLPDAGVGVRLAGNVQADMTKGTADLTGVQVKALGLDIGSEVHAVNLSATPEVTGTVALAEFNPRKLLADIGESLPPTADPSALTRLQAAFSIASHGDTFDLRSTQLKLDNTTLSLAMSVVKPAGQGQAASPAVSGKPNAPSALPVPKVDFTLKADSLDTDSYLPAAMGEKSTAPKKEQAARQEVTAVVPAEITGTVEIGKLTAAKLHMREVNARIAVKDNMLTVDPVSLSLYQGSIKASLRAGLRGGVNAPLAANVNGEGIQVEPLLTDMLGKAQLSGRASLGASVTAKGQEVRQILATLGGKAAFNLRDGAILGFDLSPDVFSSKEKLLAQGKGPFRTPFQVIGGSFVITNGVAHGTDLVAVVPPHKVTGQGSINLAAETLDYTVKASFAKLPPIPVHLTGSLKDPNVSVDTAALATGVAKGVVDTAVKAPGAIINAPENLGKGALDAVGGFLGLPKK
jgi:AsmA protein